MHRAKQLGFEYPRLSEPKLIDQETLNVLFVCSMNRWRSPTAEKIYRKKPLMNVRSAGTSKQAVRTVTASDIRWADVVFAMEQTHLARLNSWFPGEMRYRETHVLDIPDDYKYMDPELIAEIVRSVDAILYAPPDGT